MRNLIMSSLLFTLFSGYAQSKDVPIIGKVNEQDSLEISHAFTSFITAIEKHDEKTIKSYLLPEIDCIGCFENSEFKEDGYIVSSERFYKSAIQNFTKSPVYIALQKRGYQISTMLLKDFKPKGVPNDYPKDLLLFELWIQTYLPDEWAKGHEGQANAFQFVKVKNKYKLYGTTSVP